MARRDRLKQGEEAKQRVMERLAGGGGESTVSTPSRRIDRLKSPDIINEAKAGINKEVRAMAPELFNPQQNLAAFNKMVQPTFGPVKPTESQQRETENAQLPGRDIPVVGSILKGIDKLQAFTEPAAKVAEQLYTPGAGLTAIGGATAATGNLISKLAPKLGMGAGTLPTIGREVIKEGVVGAQLGAGQSLAANPQGGLEQAANQAKWGAIYGAAGGGLLAGVGKAAQSIMSKYRRPTPQPTLELPAPRERGNVNTVGDIQTITPEYTFKLPDVSPSSLNRMDNVNQARTDLKVIDDEIRQLESSYERALVEEYNYLKQSMGQKSQRGMMIKNPVTGEVTDRIGTISGNPKWYQEISNKSNGYKKPSNKDLYALARKRVDEGFQDEMGDVPSWKAQNGFDENISTLQDVRAQIDNSIREVDPALKITDSPIVSKELSFNPARSRKERLKTEADPEVLNSSPKQSTPIQEADEIVAAVNNPRVRDRVYSYLDEAEKSARERIAKRRNRLSANPIDEWADHAIVMAAQLGKGTIKTADFTEALVREFGESIRPQANKILIKTKEVLRTQERKASKEGAAAAEFNNSGMGNVDSFDAKISRNVSKKKTPFSERWEKIRTQFVDDLAPLEGLEKRVSGRLESAEDSLYKTARLYKGTPEKASQIVTTRLAPVIQAAEKAGYSADDVGRYALAKHAKDVNAAGYKSGFTNAEIDDVLAKYGSAEMDAAQQELVNINRDMMKELVDNGVVSKQISDVLEERWKNYIPLFRAFDDNKVEFGSGMSGALANVASPIKALRGSERAVIDPLENMVKNIFQSTSAAERNKVATQLAKLATKDTDSQFIRKLSPEEQVGRKNVVNVKVDGENVKYEVEPEVYKALLNLDQESSNMLINVLSKPASLLRAGATLTPEFSLRNPMRDVAQAFITSNSGFNPFTDFGAGLIQSISKGKLYRDWIDNSGAYGNIISQDRNVHKQALEKVLKQPVSKKFVNVVNGKGLINILRAITDTTESATKVGEYRAALRQGQTKQEAAYRARDIMDFGRAGTSVRQTNKVVAFLNANIQGKSKILRAIKANPIAVTTRAFVAVTVPTIGIYALNEAYANATQRQTLDEAPDWQKDSFWLIAIPGTDQVARIPKPFDIAPIFANLPEKALQYVKENDKEAFDGFIDRTIKSSSLPAQISGLLPFIEGMANYSFFREGSIIPQSEQNREFKDQYDPIRTTETAKFLAAGADKLTGGKGVLKNFSSPRIMDSTIKGLTAGLGTYATDAVDSILQGKVPFTGIKAGPSIIDRPTSPEKRIEQQPLAKAFLIDPLQGGKSMDKFYTEREKLQSEKSSAAINDKEFTQEKRLKYLNKVSSAMSDLNKKIREIERSDMSAKYKRDNIEPLTKERNRLAQEAVKGGVAR